MSSRNYSLYLCLPNERECGDATVCTYSGKYRTFFWGADNASSNELALRLLDWFSALVDSNIELDPIDRELVYEAVLYNKINKYKNERHSWLSRSR